MKQLKLEFVKNCDGCGKHKFVQLRREGDVCLYERLKMDGNHFGYEVFITKTVKAGSPLPGGLKVEEDYEQYPGSSQWGKTAFSPSTLSGAEERFAELVAKSKVLSDAREQTAVTGKRVRARKIVNVMKVKPVKSVGDRKGRKSVDRTQFVFPDGEWTMKQAHTLNPTVCHATIWTYAKQLVKSGDLIVCGQMSGGRGKPTLLYRFATSTEKLAKIDTVSNTNGTPF